jgi:hypothetical protein
VDRSALFVDAGYLLADGAMAVHGPRYRGTVTWEYAGLLKMLAGISRDHTGLPVLRCYWYAETPDGYLTADHDALANLPGLKLRLSQVRPGQPDGVAAEIRRDLTTLARNSGISDAVIVSDRDSLAQAISEAQDYGVRVTVMHISRDGSWTVSGLLRQESDEVAEISATHLRPFTQFVPGNAAGSGDGPELARERYSAPSYLGAAAGNGNGRPLPQRSRRSLPGAAYNAPAAVDYPSPQTARGQAAASPQWGDAAPGGPQPEAAIPPLDADPGASGIRSPAVPGVHRSAGWHESAVHKVPDRRQHDRDRGAWGRPGGQGLAGTSDRPPRLPESEAELPSRPGGPELPSGMGGAELPSRPGGPELPSGMGGAELPSRIGGMPAHSRREPRSSAQVPAVHPAPVPSARVGSAPHSPAMTAQPTTAPAGGGYPPETLTGPGFAGSGPADPGHQRRTPASTGGPVAPGQGTVGPDNIIQAARAQGYDFGQGIASDAPALWLEAVLARKPRMPSDLEAQLLRGARLPSGSLLDGEVVRALRRGFWDALERSRR